MAPQLPSAPAGVCAAGPLTLPQALVERDFAEQHFCEWQGLTNEELRQLTLPEALVEPDFAEQHFGEWQGLTNEELRQRRNGELNRFWLAPAHEAPPGGESFLAVIGRVAAAMARLTAAHRGRDIVAVAHGGSIRAALAVALGIEAERALAFTIDNCSLTRLDHIADPGADDEGQWRINAVNLHPRLPRLG